jgi:hypothetical protein
MQVSAVLCELMALYFSGLGFGGGPSMQCHVIMNDNDLLYMRACNIRIAFEACEACPHQHELRG